MPGGLLTDLYELNMAVSYLRRGNQTRYQSPSARGWPRCAAGWLVTCAAWDSTDIYPERTLVPARGGAAGRAPLPSRRSSHGGGLSPLAAGPAALPAALPRHDPDPMKGWFEHRDSPDRDAPDPGKLDDMLLSLSHVVADRACCCPARPVVTVIMPPAPGRPHPVDLLLCGHHFRVSQAALTAAGAAVYDDTGALVAGYDSEYEHDPREHAAAA